MTQLEQAVDLVNTAGGRTRPIVEIAKCQYGNCRQQFAIQVQDAQHKRESDLPFLCPNCQPLYRAEKRRNRPRGD